mmetsp:Transcript_1086/g.3029  ORF Transcript_1086/g.3029 Transcript_1086/m.3029 type:complete len:204 (-) Transcript_1086:1322-1933(-)
MTLLIPLGQVSGCVGIVSREHEAKAAPAGSGRYLIQVEEQWQRLVEHLPCLHDLLLRDHRRRELQTLGKRCVLLWCFDWILIHNGNAEQPPYLGIQLGHVLQELLDKVPSILLQRKLSIHPDFQHSDESLPKLHVSLHLLSNLLILEALDDDAKSFKLGQHASCQVSELLVSFHQKHAPCFVEQRRVKLHQVVCSITINLALQ